MEPYLTIDKPQILLRWASALSHDAFVLCFSCSYSARPVHAIHSLSNSYMCAVTVVEGSASTLDLTLLDVHFVTCVNQTLDTFFVLPFPSDAL